MEMVLSYLMGGGVLEIIRKGNKKVRHWQYVMTGAALKLMIVNIILS